MKRFLFSTVMIGCLPLLAACTQSPENAARDVDRAQDQAAQNVREEQRELEEVKRDSVDRIAQQQRRVDEAKREGREQVIEEQRDLEEAKREQARDDARTSDDIRPLPPTPEDRAAADRPGRLDVDVNRTPGGGVNIDVNRDPELR
jgi:hypothetical protein